MIVLLAAALHGAAAVWWLAAMVPGGHGGGPPPPPPGSSGSGRWSGNVWRDIDGRMYIDGRWFAPTYVDEPQPVSPGSAAGGSLIYRMAVELKKQQSELPAPLPPGIVRKDDGTEPPSKKHVPASASSSFGPRP